MRLRSDRMLQQTSANFRVFFLREFTKELIKNSAKQTFEIKQPQKIIKSPIKQQAIPPRRQIPVQRRKLLSPLNIPEISLPLRLQYLKPTPDKLQIDLGKLNLLIKDPAVRSIECHGPGENIIVKGTMGTKPTAIILNKEDINFVIDAFSKVAKIPVQKGIFKVAAGNLVLSAITSEIISSKFIINKLIYPIKDRIFQNAGQNF